MTKTIEKQESRTDVWSDLDRVFHELSAGFFEPYGFAGAAVPTGPDGARFRPARTDVVDAGASYRIVAEVPGIPKEKIDVRVRGSTVEIRGESAEESTSDGAAYVHRERLHRGYYRALELPEPVVASDAKAKVEGGLLELELPKQHPTPSPDEVQVPVH